MIDPQQLLEARLWVARVGERDIKNWWATDAILGEDGAYVGPRVLPRTHHTGRARIAFAVACAACDDRHPDPEAFHLFRLSPETEDRFDQLLVDRLKDAEWWGGVLAKLEVLDSKAETDEILKMNQVVNVDHLDYAKRATLGPAGRSLECAPGQSLAETVSRLAAGFIRSEAGSLAVPYVTEIPDE